MTQISAPPAERLVLLSSRLFAWLLGLYPPQFRREYGPHMAQVFRDCCREAVRHGPPTGLARLWLGTLADLGRSAMREWFEGWPGPGYYAHKIGVGLAGGMAGGAAAGLGARLSMRGVALAAGLTPQFTVEGTIGIAIVGLVMGAPFGVIYMALRRHLPGSGVWKGLAYGVLLVLVFMVPTLLFYREGEVLLARPEVGLALFGPLGLLYGAGLALAVARLERTEVRQAMFPPLRLNAAGGQLFAGAVFAGLLELGVLGAGSITHHVPSLPLGLVRALPDLNIPFQLVRSANAALVNLAALCYFGLSALIFWQRSASRLPRLAAGLLLLFGGGLFNTGAVYYAALKIDPPMLQAVFHGLQVLGCTALVALLYLFPHGRLAAPWLRPLGLGWLGWAAAWALLPALPEGLSALALVFFLGGGLAAQRQRYRAASAEEQAQVRWPLRGFAAAAAGLLLAAALLVALPDLRLPKVPGLAVATTLGPFMLPWALLPLSIGFAMWRRRLWAGETAASPG